MTARLLTAPMRYRTVFVSDVHLGARGCRADFLASISAERIFLVGDIIDGWRLRKSWFWDEHHDAVIRQLLRHAQSGADITYIPGNHDEIFRAWLPMEIAGIHLAEQAEHVTADGRRLLVLHGDSFDSVVATLSFSPCSATRPTAWR